MGLIIVLVLVGLVISYVLSEEFMEIASNKGYYNRKYFWYCFLFGIAGYLIVIALPAKEEGVHQKGFSVENNTIDKHEDKNEYIGNFPKSDFSNEDGLKQCPNCGTCHDSAYEVCPACKYTYNK